MSAVEKIESPEETSYAVVANTPMSMIDRAISGGASIEVIEKLMALQERWDANQSRKLFDEALANAQGEMPALTKNRLVNYASQKSPTGFVTYRHEDLAEVIETVKPVLKKFGLAHRFRTTQEGDKITVTCIITGHGHREENSLSAGRDTSGGKNNHQEIASAVTYLERYTLKAALGLAAAHDDDAAKAGADGGTISEDQASELIALADEVGADKRAFCEYFKIDGIAMMPAKDFERAKIALNKKRAK